MHRFLLGILFGIGLSALVAATGLFWPETGSPTAHAALQAGPRETTSHFTAGGRLTVHQPVPHPALLAAAQLFISLYVLIAQQPPRDEAAA